MGYKNGFLDYDYSRHLLRIAMNKGISHGSCFTRIFEEKQLLYKHGEFYSISNRVHNEMELSLYNDEKVHRLNRIDSSEFLDYETIIKQCMETNAEEQIVFEQGIKSTFIKEEADYNVGILVSRIEEFLTTVKKDYPNIVIQNIKIELIEGINQYIDSSAIHSKELFGKYKMSITLFSRINSNVTNSKSYMVLAKKMNRPIMEMGAIKHIIQLLSESNKKIVYDVGNKGNIMFMPDILEKIVKMVIQIYASDKSLLKGYSSWKGKINKPIVSKDFSLLLNYQEDGIIATGNILSRNGYINTKLNLIDEGILRNFLISKNYMDKLGMSCSFNDGEYFSVKAGKERIQDIFSNVGKVLVISKGDFRKVNPLGDVLFEVDISVGYDGCIREADYNKLFLKFNLNDLLNQVTSISKENTYSGSSILPFIVFHDVQIIV